jgi:hypothetical protein
VEVSIVGVPFVIGAWHAQCDTRVVGCTVSSIQPSRRLNGDLLSMCMTVVQMIIPHQQSTMQVCQLSAKQPSKSIETAMVDRQSNEDAATARNNPSQRLADSKGLRMSLM